MCKATGQAITEALTKHRKMPGRKTESKRLDARNTPTKKAQSKYQKYKQKVITKIT